MKPVNVGSILIPVKITNADEEPELEGRAAVYLYEGGYIALDEDFAEHKRWPHFGHELGHAVADQIDLHHLLIREFKLTEKQVEGIEELVCNTFLPCYLDMLQRNGWLKPPRVR